MALYPLKCYRSNGEAFGAGLLVVAIFLLGCVDIPAAEASTRTSGAATASLATGFGAAGTSSAKPPRIRYPYAVPADRGFDDIAAPHAAPEGGGERRAADRNSRFATEITGAPYEALGVWYAPTAEPDYDESGKASFYGEGFHGKPTASGEIFDSTAITAAHPTLPIPSLVHVTHLGTGREIVVRVNDRGPFHAGRIIDLSAAAARVLGFDDAGTADVRVRYLGPAPTRLMTPQIAAQIDTEVPRPPGSVRSVRPGPDAPNPGRTSPREASQPGWRLQLASFSDLSNARNFGREIATRLGTAWGRIEFEAAVVNGTDVFRVLVGSWADRESALRAGHEADRLLDGPVVVIHRPA